MSTTAIRPAPAGLTRGSALEQVVGRTDDQHRLAMARIDALGRPVTPPQTFEGHRSFGSLYRAAESDPGLLERALAPLYERTIADQVTTNNPGVMLAGWLMDVVGVIEAARPAVTAHGAVNAGDRGMELSVPYRSSANTTVAVQTIQKSEVQSVRVDIGLETSPLSTFAGASDAAAQLWSRATPNYREAYLRELGAGMAEATEGAFVAALEAAAVPATYGWDADVTGASLRSALFRASVQVQAATRRPATHALLATDVYEALGDLSAIVGPTPATAADDGIRVSVSGMPLVHCPSLTTGVVLVSNPLAAFWAESTPQAVENPNVRQLGYDIALWCVGGAAIPYPAGVVRLFGPAGSGS
jgi:hypothetical protein